ncbi:hypothetical protein B0T26DRAFT_869336 [Lasiosphaeria miniovina]|uniref:Uncharacterized protein n=1 Tax=Lasiosphaeria miniovina TaxID=1954250 RepID=A0AA40B5S8_9PEZI|nr:uncharacterized protein B0T26DRAFT_869336 [Lasiosphaeria miniovina]KAK0728215.1 hypothetical protein B0T26DRAFT_869336 [Lasiosphaeria miniovina]
MRMKDWIVGGHYREISSQNQNQNQIAPATARHLQATIADKATDVFLELLKQDGVRPHTKSTAVVVGGPKASNSTSPSLPAVPPLDYLRLVVNAGKLTQADVDRYIANEPAKPGKALRPKKQPGATPLDYLAALVKDGHFTQDDVLEYLVGKEKDMVPGLSATMKRKVLGQVNHSD